MKTTASLLFVASLIAMISSCAGPSPLAPEAQAQFDQARTLLENRCVHCHGDNRLSTMPPFSDSHALADLIGQKTWIIPGQPDRSRLYQVVTFSDDIPGAMPPTGHAISRREVQQLHDWIKAGAPVPGCQKIRFTPRGATPRSI